MMKDVYKIPKKKRIILSQPPVKGGVYALIQEFGDKFLYCSGCDPDLGNGNTVVGKLGKDLTVEKDQRAVYSCMLSLLVNLNDKVGDLNRTKRFVRVLALVSSVDDSGVQPQVVNGGSNSIAELFGEEAGLLVHLAIGTNALPGGITCETETLVELKQKYRQQRKL